MPLFQLTSSRGGWHFLIPIQIIDRYFNSHPHEEDDIPILKMQWKLLISTHILTRRMTARGFNRTDRPDISTHILTRRMTWNFIFLLTNLIFQLTSSRGGWLYSSVIETWAYDISTHILTRRMTIFIKKRLIIRDISTHILTRRMTSVMCLL